MDESSAEKRKRNTEAARRSREKIKQKIEILEQENEKLRLKERDTFLKFVR